MAPGWEMGMGMEFGMGMGMGASVSPSIAASGAPAYNNTTTTTSPAYLYGLPSADTLRIDDLLDFSNHDLFPSSSSAAATDSHLLPLPETTSANGEAGSSSDHHPHLTSFPDDLYIPSEEAAELEWLSNFVEDSFSDIPYPYSTTNLCSANAQIRVDPISSAPGRGARSKRSRGSAANTADAATVAPTWSSLTSPLQSSSSSSTSSSSSSDFPTHTNNRKKGGVGEVVNRIGMEGGVRRCTHCASEKTPQWRTGPLGPKTLCNACGVRYKSGRLVPEYRPAASPTFVLTQHSNSHRKVMELRRQKEQLHHLRHDNPSSSARPELIYHDYEVC